MRALAPPGQAPLRARQLAFGVPKLAVLFKGQVAALCEVAQMLTDRLGLPAAIGALFAYVAERWDGKGEPGRAKRDEIPLAGADRVRDAAFQRMLGGGEFAARIARERRAARSIPLSAGCLRMKLRRSWLDTGTSAWEETLACEPSPRLTLQGEGDRWRWLRWAISPTLSLRTWSLGRSGRAGDGGRGGFGVTDLVAIRRAALVHDAGESRSRPASGNGSTADTG